MDKFSLKHDLQMLAEHIKMVRSSVEKFSPDYAGASVLMDAMLDDLRSVWSILFFPPERK